jgi:CheY-like chemotaxis protein
MPDQHLKDCRVLVVEDTYFIADEIGAALRNAGAVVVGPAANRDAALSLLASEAVDAAVLDVSLKGETVYRVADLLLARRTPFVFASGYGRNFLPQAYDGIGLWEKPFDPRALVGALPALIAQARAGA